MLWLSAIIFDYVNRIGCSTRRSQRQTIVTSVSTSRTWFTRCRARKQRRRLCLPRHSFLSTTHLSPRATMKRTWVIECRAARYLNWNVFFIFVLPLQICAICSDPFEQFYSDEEEEWYLRDAVRVDDLTYHPICYQDYKEVRYFFTFYFFILKINRTPSLILTIVVLCS